MVLHSLKQIPKVHQQPSYTRLDYTKFSIFFLLDSATSPTTFDEVKRDSIDLNGAARNTTRLRLFHFSLHGQAINWLDRLPVGSISTCIKVNLFPKHGLVLRTYSKSPSSWSLSMALSSNLLRSCRLRHPDGY
ncbi:hypothetical protein Tco_0006350 [Tanacetum coccineum]